MLYVMYKVVPVCCIYSDIQRGPFCDVTSWYPNVLRVLPLNEQNMQTLAGYCETTARPIYLKFGTSIEDDIVYDWHKYEVNESIHRLSPLNIIHVQVWGMVTICLFAVDVPNQIHLAMYNFRC